MKLQKPGIQATGVAEFAIALVATCIFFFPSLIKNSETAGYLYTGDVLGYYWPSLQKMEQLISSFRFGAIDINTFNGSSDFFMQPNFFGAHPFFVLYSLLFPTPDMTTMGHVLVVALALHSFASCFFAIRLARTYLGLDLGPAAFLAVFFSFGQSTVNALGEPMFLFCTSMWPWCVYAAMRFSERPSLQRFLIAVLPALLIFLGGYVPIGLATLLLAAATIAFLHIVLGSPDASLRQRALSTVAAGLPMVCAGLIVAPYYVEVLRFMKDSPSAQTASLFYSAHQLAELPQSILRILSVNLPVPGPFYEASVQWGLIPILVALLFVLSPAASKALSQREWTVLKAAFAVYAATVLAIYGTYSPLSDMVFHFVPQIGGMHIYQRFFYAANLLLGISLALMLLGLVRLHSTIAFRIATVVGIFLLLAAAYLMAWDPVSATKMGLSNALVFELMLLSLFAAVLTAPGNGFKFAVATVLMAMPTINTMYNYSRPGFDLADMRPRQQVLLDPQMQERIAAFMRQNVRDKALIKYVDITPMWTNGMETFSKSFPYRFPTEKLQFSSYTGFNFYLAPRAGYMRMMPIGELNMMRPDWEYALRTGADYVVAREVDYGRLVASGIIDANPATQLRLPGDVVIARTASSPERPSVLFDNGFFKIEGGAPSPLLLKNARNLALGKPAQQSGTFADAVAMRATDGNTDGDFAKGSVAHTSADPNAWLQIDLGKPEQIDAVTLWNRTDCCQGRLSDSWVLLSDDPFAPGETAETARARPGVWSRLNIASTNQVVVPTPGAHGRFVRIQLAGHSSPQESYLNLAEVQVLQASHGVSAPGPQRTQQTDAKVTRFKTDNATYFRLDVMSTTGARVMYGLWPHPRLRFTIDGKKVQPVLQNNAAVIEAPPGRHRIEVRYHNKTFSLFWLLMAAYFALLAAVLGAAFFATFARLRSPA